MAKKKATRPLNIHLKMAMFETGKKQSEIARRARLRPEQLSHAIHGTRDLTEAERARLAKVLGKPESELFSVGTTER